MTMKKLSCVAAIAILLAGTAVVMAEPLNPAHVSAEAKWLIHIDFDAAENSPFAKRYEQEQGERLQKVNQHISEHYGIKSLKGLSGLTLYGTNYEQHRGTAVLFAEYDGEKMVSFLKQQSGYKAESHGDVELHTWTQHDARHNQDFEITAAFPKENVLVAGRPAEDVKQAVDLVNGKGTSLKGKESPLVGEVPKGTIFRGAAVELAGLKQRERPMPILSQGKKVNVVFGESEGKTFANSTFEAESAEVADQLQQVLEGFKAMAALQTAEQPALKPLTDALKFKKEGQTISTEWQADSEKLIEAAEQMEKRRREQRAKRQE